MVKSFSNIILFIRKKEHLGDLLFLLAFYSVYMEGDFNKMQSFLSFLPIRLSYSDPRLVMVNLDTNLSDAVNRLMAATLKQERFTSTQVSLFCLFHKIPQSIVPFYNIHVKVDAVYEIPFEASLCSWFTQSQKSFSLLSAQSSSLYRLGFGLLLPPCLRLQERPMKQFRRNRTSLRVYLHGWLESNMKSRFLAALNVKRHEAERFSYYEKSSTS